MGASIWDLFVKLGIDTKDFDQGIDGAVSKSDSAGKSMIGNLSKVGGAVVLGGLAAAGAGVVALGGFLASTIGPASDLSETVSKVGIVFGSSAESVLTFGKNAASGLGMSENAALSAAGTYGNLFRALGMTESASADMSVNVVQLAGDLASFNNMPTADVLEKLRAGLTGETEPLKSLGVNLNQAGIEAEAMSLGLMKSGGTLTAAAKAQASYSLIMKQTSLAQGDFARTSGGLANQQRILKATFDNIKSTVGTALLPVITKLANKMNEWLSNPAVVDGLTKFATGIAEFAAKAIEYIPQVIDWFSKVFAWFQANPGVIIGILAALGAAVGVWAVTTAIAMAPVVIAMLPVLAVLAAIGVAAYLVYTAWTENWGGIQETMAGVWAVLSPIFESVRAWLAENIPVAIQALSDFWNNVLLPAITNVWNWIQTNLIPVFKQLGDYITTMVNSVVPPLVDLWNNKVLPSLKGVWDFISTTLKPLLEALGKFLEGAFKLAWAGIQLVVETVLLPAFKAVGDFISKDLWPILEGLAKFLGGVFTTAINAVITVVNGIGAAFQWVYDRIMEALSAFREWTKAGAGTPSITQASGGVAPNLSPGATPGVGRAAGGPVWHNEPVLVGEQGTELFVPPSDGEIIPHSKLGGNTSTTFNIYGWQGDSASLAREIDRQASLERLLAT